MSRSTSIAATRETAGEPGWLEYVREHVGSLRYGVVQIVVHDGYVTQIEKTERVRFDNSARAAALRASLGDPAVQ